MLSGGGITYSPVVFDLVPLCRLDSDRLADTEQANEYDQ